MLANVVDMGRVYSVHMLESESTRNRWICHFLYVCKTPLQGISEGSYALIGIVKGSVILLLCVMLELLAICLMGNAIVYIDI